MCELLRKIADLGLTGPITLVLDNARYQRNAVVQTLAAELGITIVVLALVLAQPEPHRTTVEVHEASRPPWSLPPDVPGLSSRHPRGSRRIINQVLRSTGLVDDTKLSAIRRRVTHGRVRYNSFSMEISNVLVNPTMTPQGVEHPRAVASHRRSDR
jgi:hypothetical protein